MQEELQDTQPVRADDLCFSQEFDLAWGKLYGNRKAMKSHALVNEVTTIGRAPSCDITIAKGDVSEDKYSIISKVHFQISKKSVDGKMTVILEDLSSNGTFVNGNRVGKGNTAVLRNNDDICIGVSYFHVFLFVNGHTTVEGYTLPRKIREEYVISRKVGEGTYGVVYSVFRKRTDERFAMKIVPKNAAPLKNGKKITSDFVSEVKVLKTLDHPFVIKLEEVIEDEDAVFILMEMMDGGELGSKISGTRPNEKLVKFYFFQIAGALKYLHDNGITHRDLKVDNVLLSSDEAECLVKVADFGMARILDENTVMKTICGSPMYVAPEVLKVGVNGSYTNCVDIWSLGVLLYVCLSGRFPFQRTNFKELTEDILRGAYTFPMNSWSGISIKAIDLVKKMMTVDPRNRLTISGVLSHPWLKDPILQRKIKKLMENSNSAEYEPPVKRRLVE